MSDSDFYNVCLSKAMALCAGRENCSSDIHSKLVLWGSSETMTEEILTRLRNERFIDDKRYSMAFVKDKFRYNKWGKIKIASHLKMKKIPDEIIGSALASIDHGIYIDAIKKLLLTRRKSIRAKNIYDLKARLLRYGLSKGFESSILYDIINDMEVEELKG